MTFISANNRFRLLWPMALLLCIMHIPSAFAAETKAMPSEESAATQSDQEAETTRRQFDLGPFQIRQLRPTRNETIGTKFELTLMLPEDSSKRVEAQLENWKHRLRDQVITSVRLTETNDFSEPELRQFQRLTLLRINRMLKFTRIEGLYFTRFEFVLE